MAKEEAKHWRKQEKVSARSQSLSSEDSISMLPDLEDEDNLGFWRMGCESRTCDVSYQGPSAQTEGRPAGAGSSGNWSIVDKTPTWSCSPPRGGVTVEHKLSAGSSPMGASLPWMQVQLGPVRPGTTGLPWALLDLSPLGRKLPLARSEVLLVHLLQDFKLPRMFKQVTGPPGTGRLLIRLTAQLGLPPYGRELPWARSPVLLDCLRREIILTCTIWLGSVPLRSGLPQTVLSDCRWGGTGQVTQLGWHLMGVWLPRLQTPWVLGHPWTGWRVTPQRLTSLSTRLSSVVWRVWHSHRCIWLWPLHRQPGQQPLLRLQWVVNQQRGIKILVHSPLNPAVRTCTGVIRTAGTYGSYCGIYSTFGPTNYGTYCTDCTGDRWDQTMKSQFISSEQFSVYSEWIYEVAFSIHDCFYSTVGFKKHGIALYFIGTAMGISASVWDPIEFATGLGIRRYAAAMARQQCLRGSTTTFCGSADNSTGAQCFTTTSAALAGMPGQQAQDTVTMASAM